VKKRLILACFYRAVVAGAICLSCELAAAQESGTASTSKRDDAVEITLRDGSLIRGVLNLKSFDVETIYGKLSVPLTDVIRIRMGRNAAPNLKAQIERLIAKLGDNSFQVREQAQADLAKMGAQAFNELQAALQSSDAEIVTRAKILLEGLSAEQPADPLKDEMETKSFAITGDIKFAALSVARHAQHYQA
jgi:hypothetical protein